MGTFRKFLARVLHSNSVDPYNPLSDPQYREHILNRIHRAELSHMGDTLPIATDPTFILNDSTSGVAKQGNRYPTANAQINQLSAMYRGTAGWGCQLTQSIINIRSAFTIASGIKVFPTSKTADESSRELKFCEEFINCNNLNEEVPQDWTRESEIEGRLLCVLQYNPDWLWGDGSEGMVKAVHVPYSIHPYTVYNTPYDYTDYTRVEFVRPGDKKVTKVTASNFVYARFGGRSFDVNYCNPKIGGIVKQIQDLDKALFDLRRINSLFASPTPYFKVGTPNEMQAMNALLATLDWKIGKQLAGTADFSMVGPDVRGVDSIQKEITTLVKIISGGSGVPVHFFGFPDLMSNRATAQNLMEFVFASTSRERRILIGFYNKLFRKAMVIHNVINNDNLDPNAVEVGIPMMSEAHMEQLREIWLPMFLAGSISLETLLDKIPELNSQREIDRIEQQAANILAKSDMSLISSNKIPQGDERHGGVNEPQSANPATV